LKASLLFALLPPVLPCSASTGVCAMQKKTGFKYLYAAGGKANTGCRAAG